MNLKKNLFLSLTLLSITNLWAQQAIEVNKPKTLNSIVKQIENKKVIALGEGTHGTKEFNQVRAELVKKLVDKGFNKIIFEAAYGDMYYLNQGVNSEQDLQQVMEKYLLSIWQTKEIKEFLHWIRAYNKTAKTPIELMGFDVNFIGNSAIILQESTLNDLYPDLVQNLLTTSEKYDFLWAKNNDKTFKLDFNTLLENGISGYKSALELQQNIQDENLQITKEQTLALNNLRYAFGFMDAMKKQDYHYTRDKIMANMVLDVLGQNQNNKAILWAHSAHLALKPLVMDPMGMYLKEKLHDNYFVIATIPAYGTVSQMVDQVDTKDNTYNSYPIDPMPEDSWNIALSKLKPKTFYLDLNQDPVSEVLNQSLSFRIIGYNKVDHKQLLEFYTFNNIILNEYFDAVLFFRNSTASEHFHY